MQIPLGPGPEFDLIRSFFRARSGAAPHAAVRVGPGDDCAVVEDGIALSTDIAVENVHFRHDWLTSEEIGYRAAAAAISDLAAVAAAPIGVLVSLAVPAADAAATAPRIMDGVRAAAEAAGAVLLGGDMSRIVGPLVIDVVAVGRSEQPVLRSGAQPGDVVWVTGRLGAAAAAVRSWLRGAEPVESARRAFAAPIPRTAEAQWLAARGMLHALIDISDGLAGDAGHMSAASGVRIVLDAESIPVHTAVHAEAAGDHDALRIALTGGEDYELCFAAPAGAVEPMIDSFDAAFGIPLTRVGSIEAGAGVALRTGGRIHPLPWSGHDHFARQSP